MKTQKSIVVVNYKLYPTDPGKTTDDLNQLLDQGWTVVLAAPMSAANTDRSYSLVILERDESFLPTLGKKPVSA